MAFQVIQALVSLGGFESTLGKPAGEFGRIEGVLDSIELHIKASQLVVVLAVPDDVSQDALVIKVGRFGAQLFKEGSWTQEELPEPGGHSLIGAHVGRRGGAVNVGNIGFVLGLEVGPQHGHASIVEALDPFGWDVDSTAHGDDESWVLPVVGGVPHWGVLRGACRASDPQLDVTPTVGHLALEVLYLASILSGVLGIFPVSLLAGGQEPLGNGGGGCKVEGVGVLQHSSSRVGREGRRGAGMGNDDVGHLVDVVVDFAVAGGW